MKTEPSQPIHPTIWDCRNSPSFERDNDGMTLRQYYAGLAMQAHITAAPDYIPAKMAEWAVKNADALITELNKS